MILLSSMLAAQEPIDCGPSIIQKAKTTILEKFRTEFLKEFESVVDVDVCGTDYRVVLGRCALKNALRVEPM